MRRATADPMKPAPPVTSNRIVTPGSRQARERPPRLYSRRQIAEQLHVFAEVRVAQTADDFCYTMSMIAPNSVSPSPFRTDATAAGYDAVAQEYANHIFQELDDKPFDRAFLERFAAAVPKAGLVLDLGCGPGHVGRFLAEHGRRVRGVDMSARMVEWARRLNPQLSFEQGDLRALAQESASADAVVAFYSIIHLQPEELPTAFAEMQRAQAGRIAGNCFSCRRCAGASRRIMGRQDATRLPLLRAGTHRRNAAIMRLGSNRMQRARTIRAADRGADAALLYRGATAGVAARTVVTIWIVRARLRGYAD